MNTNDVKISEYYHLNMLPDWDSMSGDFLITGYSSPGVIGEVDPSANIYSTFFKNYGFDIDKYNRYINDSTLIFIALPVTSKDPIETVDENERVYIPSTLINFTTSYKYVGAQRYTYTVDTGVKLFNTTLETDEFISESKNKVRKAVRAIDDFIVDSVSCECKTTRVLTTVDALNDAIKAKNEAIQKRENASRTYRETQEANTLNMITKTTAAEKASQEYAQKTAELTSRLESISEYYDSNANLSTELNNVKENLGRKLVQLKTGEISIDSFQGTTGEELYNWLLNLD